MRKLIEMTQEHLIVCDNINCNYTVENPTKDVNVSIKEYLNKPCPKCGDNLLTEKDFKESEKLIRFANWANKWLSWITFFIPEKKEKTVIVHVHNGIKIEDEKVKEIDPRNN